MTDRLVQVSVRVGDATEGPPSIAFIEDLSHLVHVDAAEHFGRSRGCRTAGFARDHKGGRDGFEAALRHMGVGEEHVREYLGEWDEATRPIAVIHWWEDPIQ